MSVILTILLTVLKIIGIALLVILGLILLILLLVLFVPLRYDVRGVKETSSIREARAFASLTWLLRLIGLEASYDQGTVTVLLRILTFRLKEIHIPEKSSGPDPSSGEETVRADAAGEEDPVKEQSEADTGKAEPAAKEQPKADTGKAGPVTMQQTAPDTAETKPVITDTGKKKAAKKEAGTKPEKKASAKAHEKKDPPRKKDKGNKIGEWIASIPMRIAGLIQSVFDTADRIDDAVYKAERKIEGLFRKAEPFISEDSRGLYMRTLRRLMRMLSHFLPKKISGYLHFGTGAPDLTGELTGVIYLALPAGSRSFSVEPEFNERVLETDCRIRGHIRFIHALVFLIRTAFDRQVWRLIRTIRRSKKKAGAK